MHNRKILIIITTMIFLGSISFAIRAHFVWTIVEQDLYRHISIPADGKEYIHLAQNLVRSGTYATPSPTSRYLALLRPPGYPGFLAIFEFVEASTNHVFWVQAVLSSLIPVLVAFIALTLSGSISLAFFTGLLSTISVTGVYLSGQIMADLLLAFVFLLSFVLTLWGIVRKNGTVLILSGLGYGLSALIKPLLIFWPIVSLIIVYLISKGKNKPLKRIILIAFCALQVVPIIAWCGRNYVEEDLFSLSTISIRTLRQYLANQVEVSTIDGWDYGTREFVQSISSRKTALHSQYLENLKNGMTLKSLTKEQLHESLDIMKSAPLLSVKFYMFNVVENLSGLFLIPSFFLKLPPEQLAITDKLLLLDYFGKFLRKIWYSLMVLFVISSPFIMKKYCLEKLTMLSYSIYALILTFVYFALLSGVTFWTGPRIVFPADFAMLISGMMILAYYFELFRISRGKE